MKLPGQVEVDRGIRLRLISAQNALGLVGTVGVIERWSLSAAALSNHVSRMSFLSSDPRKVRYEAESLNSRIMQFDL